MAGWKSILSTMPVLLDELDCPVLLVRFPAPFHMGCACLSLQVAVEIFMRANGFQINQANTFI
jgi:hypothetical protein